MEVVAFVIVNMIVILSPVPSPVYQTIKHMTLVVVVVVVVVDVVK